MKLYFIPFHQSFELIDWVRSIIFTSLKVNCAGSMTLFESVYLFWEFYAMNLFLIEVWFCVLGYI